MRICYSNDDCGGDSRDRDGAPCHNCDEKDKDGNENINNKVCWNRYGWKENMDRLYYTLMIKLETSNPKKGQRLSNRSVCASFGE